MFTLGGVYLDAEGKPPHGKKFCHRGLATAMTMFS